MEKKKTVNINANAGANIKDIAGEVIVYRNGSKENANKIIMVEVRFLTESFWSFL